MPMVCANTAAARKDVLLSYAVSHPALFRRAADFVDKILKGAKPPGWLGARRHDSALAFDLGGAVASTDRVFFVVTVTQF